MRLRVKFSKEGLLRYVGHLDFLRYTQKMIVRSGIPAAYSAGFHPHMILAFASPLSVGSETEGDYFELEAFYADPFDDDLSRNYRKENGFQEEDLRPCPGSQELVARMNAVNVPEVRILSVRRISPLRSDQGMANVAYATYRIELPKEKRGFAERFPEFLSRSVIETSVEKKIKTKRKRSGAPKTESVLVDIRPFIVEGGVSNENELIMRLACGSERNLKADTLIKAFAEYLGIDLHPWEIRIVRTELFDAEGITLEERGREF